MVLSSVMRAPAVPQMHQFWRTSSIIYNPMRTGSSLFFFGKHLNLANCLNLPSGFSNNLRVFQMLGKKLNTVKYFNKQSHLEFFKVT